MFDVEPGMFDVFKLREAAEGEPVLGPGAARLFSRRPSRRLVMNGVALERWLAGKNARVRNFAERRLKMLMDRCSAGVRSGDIPMKAVNRLAAFCLHIIPLFERNQLVMPTAVEMSCLFNWYLARDANKKTEAEPAVVLSVVCPDYPYEWSGNKAVYTDGPVGDGIGLIGESILNTAPGLVRILSESLKIPVDWVVGYAGFEGKPVNLERMKMSADEFENRLKTSGRKLEKKLGVPVGILPGALGMTPDEFNRIRDGFGPGDFQIRRKGMDALSDAVDARDWAGVFALANGLNAMILDGASVYMGRKAYKKAADILKPDNFTPQFFCVSNYVGFRG